MENKIYENEFYYVTTGISDEIKTIHYKVINKNYGVVEAETALYPQALKYADDLATATAALSDINKETNKIIPLTKNKTVN